MPDLIDRFLTVVERYAARIEVELEQDPPVVVAYAESGLAFAAAWTSDEGLVVRIRLDAQVPPASLLEHVEGGSLTYEARINNVDELQALDDTLRRSEQLAERRFRN
jgi:hypothetical protein